MSIDWSKAPEGATHWEPSGPSFNEGWMKKEGNEWFYWSEGTKRWFQGKLSCNVSAEREATFEARPQEAWNGQGLPPVGTEVEANFTVTDTTGTHYHWRRVIVAVAGIPGAERECLVYDAENTKPAWVDEFRPLRTPEQIAAEEREKAVQEMLALDEYPHGQDRGGMMSRADFCRVLYDAGYRRQEEGK
ncbi:hypothetical protein [Pseudomonas aeruginosa]|uniref:hypothetical protein n=1 Tax=Pseudomonas aeruginosa TaxID=287 RepID=UPI002350C090|nr:hypothetical protein [Pseudomonas aeruginosa]MDF0577469.1 hypothetical protein [Pseudomonas aeruginosa]WDA47158.1 hypothetical protein PSP57_17620 [Pseudomonas aeruginosa]HEP9417234.1 hypothetical protein [Pseudomonas aeruginosa]